MKKTLQILVIISFVGIPKIFAQNKTENKIKNLIDQYHNALINQDFDSFQASWVQEVTSNRAYIDKFNYTQIAGWEKIKASFLESQKTNTEKMTEVKTKNYQWIIDKKLAIVDMDVTIKYEDESTNSELHKTFTLQKKKNDWKILKVLSSNPDSYKLSPENTENSLIYLGYELLKSNKTNEAIELFKTNVKLSPNSWNAYDSLGEAYIKASDKKLAIENYEKSVQLNPKNTNGIEALKKLKNN